MSFLVTHHVKNKQVDVQSIILVQQIIPYLDDETAHRSSRKSSAQSTISVNLLAGIKTSINRMNVFQNILDNVLFLSSPLCIYCLDYAVSVGLSLFSLSFSR